MKHFLALSLSIFLVLFFCNTGQASCFPKLLSQLYGFEAGAFGGMNGGFDLNCKHVKTNRGYYAGIKAGKMFFSSIRLEEEFSWQSNEVKSIKGDFMLFDHVRGQIDIWSFMTNGIFEFPFNCCLPARPYMGAGIGYAYAHGHWSGNIIPLTLPHQSSSHYAIENQACFNQHIKTHFHESGFAWQVIAGLNFPVCNLLTVGLEYRYFKTQGCVSNHKFGLAATFLNCF